MKKIELCYVKVKDLKFDFPNPRKITKRKRDELEQSLKELGDFGVIVIDENNNVISGNQRASILMELDREQEVLCKKLIGYTEREKKLINLKSNLHSGEWDFSLLKDFDLSFLQDIGIDFPTKYPLDNFFEEEDEEFEINNIIKKGDLIEFNEKYKVLCGDSFVKEDVKKLIKTEKSDFVFTDPEYNLKKFDWIDNLLFFHKEGFPIFIMGSDKQQIEFIKRIPYFKKFFVGLRNKGHYISNFTPMNKFTLVSFFCKNPSKFFRNKKDYFTDVFDFMCDSKKRKEQIGHAHSKQTDFIINFLEHYSNPNDLVIDFFGGSGSVLIASYLTNRKCYLIEINPLFVELIINRFISISKQNNIKINGVPFNWKIK